MCAAVAVLFVWVTTLDCLTSCLAEQLRAGDCEVVATSKHPCCNATDAAEVSSALDEVSCELAATAAGPTEGGPCSLLATSYGDAETPMSLGLDAEVAALAESVPVLLADSPAPVRPPERVANRGDTYLRCRVLLI